MPGPGHQQGQTQAGPPVPRIFGDYAALRRDYLADEFVRDVTAQGVVKSVYVQIKAVALIG